MKQKNIGSLTPRPSTLKSAIESPCTASYHLLHDINARSSKPQRVSIVKVLPNHNTASYIPYSIILEVCNPKVKCLHRWFLHPPLYMQVDVDNKTSSQITLYVSKLVSFIGSHSDAVARLLEVETVHLLNYGYHTQVLITDLKL